MSTWVIGLILWGVGFMCALAFINGAGLKDEQQVSEDAQPVEV